MSSKRMVAIEMTSDGAVVDPLGEVNVHPAAELFPLMHGPEFEDLVEDIRQHGLRERIVMTPDGQLLDGRNRWRACAQAGKEPLTRIEQSDPWAYVISTNVHRRHLSESQRAMIASKIASRRQGGDRRTPGWQTKSSIDDLVQPPTGQRAAELLNIAESSITRAKTVRKQGTSALQQAVEAGQVPVYTAAKVARELPHEQQDAFVRQVEGGASPKRLAAQLQVEGEKSVPPARSNGAPGASSKVRTDNRSPGRHRYLTIATLRSMRDSLSALDMVLKSTPDGLDPAITDEEAARWANDLSKGRGVLHRAITLLKNHKEPTP